MWLLLAALAAGALQAMAFLPQMSSWSVVLPACMSAVALASLLALLHRATRPAWGAALAWTFSLAWLVGGTAWLYVSLHQFGGLPSWLAVLSIVLLNGALSLYMAAAGALWVRWRRRLWWADAVLWAALWLLAEMARAWIFTGFPWATSGYALIDSPWVGLAPWLGVYGMAAVALAVWAAVVLSMLLRQKQVLSMLILLAALGGAQLLRQQSFVQSHGQPLSVALLQGNVPQDEKFALDRQVAALKWHAEQMLAAQADLVVLPETAVPLLPADLPGDFWPGLLKHFHSSTNAVLLGLPLGSFKLGYTNSVVGISSSTQAMPEGIYRYNKHHLVPFGEFIPFGFRWFVDLMRMPLGDFTRGPLQAPSFEVKGQWIAPNICYEDLFGEELATRFVAGTTPAPNVLANVSNLAWFGQHVAIDQHLQIARMRSLEFQRPTIRATNTGATVVIDHQGRVTAQWPFNERGVLHATVQGMQGLTPFARWAGAWGLMPLCLLAFTMVICFKQR